MTDTIGVRVDYCEDCKEILAQDCRQTCWPCMAKRLTKALELGKYDAKPSELKQGCIFLIEGKE